MRKSNEIVNWHAFSAISSRRRCFSNGNGTKKKSWQNEALLWIQCNSIWQRKLSSSRFDFTIGAQIVVDIHKHAHLCGFSHWIGNNCERASERRQHGNRSSHESAAIRFCNQILEISSQAHLQLSCLPFIFIFVMLAHEELGISSHFVPLGENQLVQVKT